MTPLPPPALQLVREVAGELETIFIGPGSGALHVDRDVFVVGTQEAPMSGRGAAEWEEALLGALGHDFARLDGIRLDPVGWIHLVRALPGQSWREGEGGRAMRATP